MHLHHSDDVMKKKRGIRKYNIAVKGTEARILMTPRFHKFFDEKKLPSIENADAREEAGHKAFVPRLKNFCLKAEEDEVVRMYRSSVVEYRS